VSLPKAFDEQLVHLDLIELMLWILVETADPNVGDARTSQNVPFYHDVSGKTL
jgi:hypothetical protein